MDIEGLILAAKAPTYTKPTFSIGRTLSRNTVDDLLLRSVE
jgi:hypothetical protein